jgi:hypothetical protein
MSTDSILEIFILGGFIVGVPGAYWADTGKNKFIRFIGLILAAWFMLVLLFLCFVMFVSMINLAEMSHSLS